MGSPFCFSLTVLHAVPRVFSMLLPVAHFPRQHHFLDDLTARNGSFKISLSFLPAFFPFFQKKKISTFFWVKNTFSLLITVIYVHYYYFIIRILLLLA